MNLAKRLAVFITVGVIGGCGLWPFKSSPRGAAPQAKPELIDIRSAGLLATQSGKPELGLILINSSAQTLRVGVAFQTPNGRSDCALVKELAPHDEGAYFCPQPALQADVDYPIQIDVANLAGERIATHDTRLRFDRQDIQTAQSTDR